MRRHFQILGLVMLAFAASGWSSIVAAVLCPHASPIAGKAVAAGSMTDDHACCAIQAETVAKPHCHDSEPVQEAAADTTASHSMTDNMDGRAALALPYNVPCTHCMGRPELPSSNVIARHQVEQKRSPEPPAANAVTYAMPALSFTQPVIYRQGAPPGSSTPKHLLIGLLLI